MKLGLRQRLLRGCFSAVVLALAFEAALWCTPDLLAWRYARAVPIYNEGDRIVVIGDSVAFGLHLPPGKGWGAQLADVLAAAGRPSQVRVNARPGTHLTEAAEQVRPCAAGAVYLAMLGHNDFVQFTDLANGTVRVEAHRPFPPIPPPLDQVRTLRLLAWSWDRLGGMSVVFTRERRLAAAAGLDALAEKVTGCGGRLVLLTYAIPGDEGPDAPNAEVLRKARVAELAVNQFLRDLAAERGTPLIDVEYLVPTSPRWDPAEFVDSIHPTAALSRRIADAVAAELQKELILPP